MRKLFFWTAVFVMSAVGSAEAKLEKPAKPDFDVLHYKINIELNEKDLSYYAKTDIRLKSKVESLSSVSLHYRKGKKNINLPAPLAKGEETVVTVESRGKADNREQNGLFVTYPEAKGLPQFFTQFEATGAREVFPCYDEPFEKATSEVILTASSRYTLLSNGRKLSEETLPDGRHRAHFLNEDPVSTYHITFVAAELKPVQSKYHSLFGKTVPLTVYTRPGTTQDVKHAMNMLKKALGFYENYFGIAYPWESYGIVALPGFTWGGMENKGLANLNAARLLWNTTHPVYKKIQIAGLVAHELAHEWFGNRVTMEWWDDLWLNEAFATFMTTKFEESVFGRDYSAVDNYRWLDESYYPQDQGPLSHPIVPGQVDTIDELFDSITYAKGVQVVRMLEDLIGPENFQQGLRNYFEKYRLGNATTADFLREMEKAGGMSLARFANSWLDIKGYPRLQLDGEWNPATEVYRLTVRQVAHPFEFKLKAGGKDLHIYRWEQHFDFKSKDAFRYLPVNEGGRTLVQYQWKTLEPDLLTAGNDTFARFEVFHQLLRNRAFTRFRKNWKSLVWAAREGLKSNNSALQLGLTWSVTDNDLPKAFSMKLARALSGEAEKLLKQLSVKDPVEAQTRQQLLTLLGQTDDPKYYALLRKSVKSKVMENKLGALGGLLRSSAEDRYLLFDKELQKHRGEHHVKLALLQTLAQTPKAEVLARINGYLLDTSLVGADDSTVPIRVWRTVHSDNKKIVYTEEGLAQVRMFVERNLDRSTVAGTALRTLEGAKQAAPEVKREIRKMMADLMKKETSEYVRSLGRKITAAAR